MTCDVSGEMTSEDMARLHGESFERGWSAETFGAYHADPRTVLVSQRHGFALAQHVLDEADLLSIVVDRAARGRGIGRTLLLRLMEGLGALGVVRLHLEVSADNGPARALYESVGFEQVGQRKAYYPRPGGAVDALLMSIDLPKAAAAPTSCGKSLKAQAKDPRIG